MTNTCVRQECLRQVRARLWVRRFQQESRTISTIVISSPGQRDMNAPLRVSVALALLRHFAASIINIVDLKGIASAHERRCPILFK